MTYVYVISNASQNQETEAEEAAQLLEHFVEGTSCTDAYPSAVFEPTLSFVAPDYPNMYWLTTNDLQRQGEKMALIREIVNAMPELDMIHVLYEVFVTRCQGPLGNVVHTPTFMKQAEEFYGCLGLASRKAQVMALSSTISMNTLACHLLAVRMALYHHLSVCSLSFFSSSCSHSPFIPHLLYFAGLLHLWLFVWKSSERQMYNPRRGGHSPCVAFKEGCRSFVVRLLVYKLP